MKGHREITKFIKNDLVELIRTDLWEYQIGNERDLETAYCFHLRNFLRGDKTRKISTNHTISGKKTSIIKHQIGNKSWSRGRKRKKSEFIMPDVTLAKNPESFDKPLDHKIGVELKLINPATRNLPDVKAEKFKRDYRKLQKLKSKRYIRTGWFFLVFSDPTITERKAQTEILKVKTSGGHGKFLVSVINRNIHPRTKKLINETDEEKRREKGRRIYRSYAGNDPRFKSNKPKNSTGGSGQKKAWVTMRKKAKNASWRRKFPNHPLTKEWKRKH